MSATFIHLFVLVTLVPYFLHAAPLNQDEVKEENEEMDEEKTRMKRQCPGGGEYCGLPPLQYCPCGTPNWPTNLACQLPNGQIQAGGCGGGCRPGRKKRFFADTVRKVVKKGEDAAKKLGKEAVEKAKKEALERAEKWIKKQQAEQKAKEAKEAALKKAKAEKAALEKAAKELERKKAVQKAEMDAKAVAKKGEAVAKPAGKEVKEAGGKVGKEVKEIGKGAKGVVKEVGKEVKEKATKETAPYACIIKDPKIKAKE